MKLKNSKPSSITQEPVSFLFFQLELEKNIRSIEELSKSVSQEEATDSDGG